MPRTAAAAFGFPVSASAERVRPPADLNAAEKAEFLAIVSDYPARKFKPGDNSLLAMHVRHSIAEREAFARYQEQPIVDLKISPHLVAAKMHASVVLLTSRRLNIHPAGRRSAPSPSSEPEAISGLERFALEQRDDAN